MITSTTNAALPCAITCFNSIVHHWNAENIPFLSVFPQ